MKKTINLFLVSVIALFLGIMVTDAVLVPVQLPVKPETYKCYTDEAKTTDLRIYTICEIGGKATATKKISGSEIWDVVYEDGSLDNDFTIIDGLGYVDGTVTKTKTGGSFTFVYSGSITKGEDVVLFKVEFAANNEAGKNCGGSVSPTGKKGTSTTDDKDDTIDDEATGVSVPMMIIGIGAITGLAVYSVASSKTKMHRI